MCPFCCYEEEGTMYPKDDYNFYAGFYKQIAADAFEEYETENIKFCPICGQKFERIDK